MDLLDKRLLTTLDDHYNEELRNLELMKVRFGEINLHKCDVMLRDIKESDRLNKLFKTSSVPRTSSALPLEKVHVNIVSPKFWRQVDDEAQSNNNTIALPAEFTKGFTDVENNFKKVKPMRKLIFS
jgi:anaphase-promoting complex subunit 2